MDVGDPDGDNKDEFFIAYWNDADQDGVKEAFQDTVVIRMVELEGGTWVNHDIITYPKPGDTVDYTLSVGDADNSGQDEIYITDEDGVIRQFKYSQGNWVESEIPSSYSLPWSSSMISDANNDGYQDLILVGRSLDGSTFALLTLSKYPHTTAKNHKIEGVVWQPLMNSSIYALVVN